MVSEWTRHMLFILLHPCPQLSFFFFFILWLISQLNWCMVWELIKNLLSCSAQNTSYRTIPSRFPSCIYCLQSKEPEGIKSHNLQKKWKGGLYLLSVVKKCSVKTWNSFPICCVLPWSLNSALSRTPDVQLYPGTTGCDKYGISALFLL